MVTYRKIIAPVLFLIIYTAASAQTTYLPVKAGVHISPPFVMNRDEEVYTGMAVDLWNSISESMGLSTEYIRYRSVDELIRALETKAVDVVVTNLTVTHQRAKVLTFTYPWYDAGLRIMVNTQTGNSFWGEMRKNGRMGSYFLIAGILIMLSLALTTLRHASDPRGSRNWKDSFSSNFRTIIAAAVSGNIPEGVFVGKHKRNRWIWDLIAGIWMLCGVAMIAYTTSTVTSVMTTVSLSNTEIQGLYDLAGRRIGALRGSASEKYLQDLGYETMSFNDIDEAAQSLMGNHIYAVVADAPVLEYWTHIHPGARVKVTGDLFHPDKYAFAVSPGSDLSEAISVQLIRLYEDRSIQKLRYNYFGQMEDPDISSGGSSK
jgi:ABC-type amino acid transport substrate-binding protein